MPATGLKIVWTGSCLQWCSISSSFKKSLKIYGHRVYEFLEFWCWNLVPFLPDIGFQLLKSLWSSLTYFLFNDMPNVLYRWKIWTAGRPIERIDSSTTKPCCCNSCSMWFALSCWNTRNLGGSICCSKTFKYIKVFNSGALCYSIHSAFQNMQAAHTISTYVPPYHQRCWLLNWTPIKKKLKKAGRSLSLVRRTRRPWFPTRMSNLDSSYHRTLFHFETVHFKWALAHRTRWRFWTLLTYGFLFTW